MPRGKALTIGVNYVEPASYEDWPGVLHGCENDARRMAQLAKAQGFDDVNMLLSSQARRQVVVEQIGAAANALESGDLFLLTFSGHGRIRPDHDGDEPDGFDENWCLYDDQLLDDRIHELLAGFRRGVRVLVVSDSCHSGSVVERLDEPNARLSRPRAFVETNTHRPRIKAMPEAVYERIHRATAESVETETGASASLVRVNASVLLLSACADKEETLDGAPNSVFTTHLLDVWRDGAFGGSHLEFRAELERRLGGQQVPQLFSTGQVRTDFVSKTPFTI